MNTSARDQEREVHPFAAREIDEAIRAAFRRLADLSSEAREAALSDYEANGLPIQMRGLTFVIHIDRLKEHARRTLGLPA